MKNQGTDSIVRFLEIVAALTLFALMAITCVDVAETDDGPMVFEVSAFGGFRGLKEANSIDAAGLYVDYVLDRVSEERGKKK